MKHSKLRAMSLMAAGVVLGGVTAGTLSAFAAGNDTSTSSPSASASPSAKDADGHRGGAGHSGEKALTGSDLAKATAAARRAVPGGTVVRAETDSGDAVYEVHMKKSDGTEVTVKLDKAFALKNVEDGMGK